MKTKKMLSKVFALLLALTTILTMSVSVFAQNVEKNPKDADNATITVKEAAKGYTYTVYQIFDATVTDTDGGSIAYQLMEGKPAPPDGFTMDATTGEITATEETKTALATATSDSNIIKTLITYGTQVGTATSDGTELTFTGLAYGYYLVTTNQGTGLVSVDSTNKNAVIYDKNSGTPVTDLKKTASGGEEETVTKDGTTYKYQSYSVGDTVTYTVSFYASNYDGTGSDAKQITKYEITDTLPTGVTMGTVTKITIDGTEYKVDGAVPQFADVDEDGAKEIIIPWVDDEGTSLYANNAQVVITYTATVNENAAIDGDGNTNTIAVAPYTKNDDGEEGKGTETTNTETIYTYALAIKKVDPQGNVLTGAKFSIAGLQAEKAGTEDGVYVVTGATAKGETDTEMECGADGVLIVKGVKAGEYTVTETQAPSGYNKLNGTKTVTATYTGSKTTTTKIYKDADGNVTDTETDSYEEYTNSSLSAATLVVVNEKGSELPSTGGIGTTVFYVIGGILVAGAAVLLIIKKSNESSDGRENFINIALCDFPCCYSFWRIVQNNIRKARKKSGKGTE